MVVTVASGKRGAGHSKKRGWNLGNTETRKYTMKTQPLIRRQHWIPVSRQKPPNSVTVLVWCPELNERGHNYGPQFGYYNIKINECRVHNTSGYYFTHWMPLPKGPRKGRRQP